ncbi:MAG: hypothetical protein SPH30_04315 [Prevotella sp.]|nr:hypothetical protein [Prevotella sp.]
MKDSKMEEPLQKRPFRVPIMPILEAKNTYLATQEAGFWKRGKDRRLMEAYRKAQPKEQKKGAHPERCAPKKNDVKK